MRLVTKGYDLYPAYKANVHERRARAVIARSVPLGTFLLFIFLSIYGVFRYPAMLLFICAFFNTSLWLYLMSSALFAIRGSYRINLEMKAWNEEKASTPSEKSADAATDAAGTEIVESGAGENPEGVAHLVVFPNYKEDEEMLAQTLHSLSEAHGSSGFRVLLGMEAREEGSMAKAQRIQERYASKFKWLTFSMHPRDLIETHMDDSTDAEVPGKASNLKWAVVHAYEECKKEGSLNLDRIVLTVADADCLFHPGYFKYISKDYTSKEFNAMRAATGSKHMYTMWQAPQLPFRNYYISPVCSRTWGYIASVDELGGVASLDCGLHHMVFSGYSMTLRLAIDAQPWDGDGVAEDHHAYLRCFFYSVHQSALDVMAERSDKVVPPLQVRPVFLPVKSTSVASAAGYWATWVERYHQARRHMQGVSEFSYAILATWDVLGLVWTSPQLLSLRLLIAMFRVNLKLFCMHILPTVQAFALAILTAYWFLNGKNVPQCPRSIRLTDTHREMVFCGLAGAWVLMWPVVVPLLFFFIANYLFLVVVYVQQKIDQKHPDKFTTWHGEDAGIPPTWGSKRLTTFCMCFFDIICCMTVLMFPYALVPEVLAFWHTAFRGNRIVYVTAPKLMEGGKGPKDYGTVGSHKADEQKAA